MADFTTEQMTEYLKQATDLEVSVYQQQQTLNQAKASLRLDAPTLVTAQEPVKRVCVQPTPPTPPEKPEMQEMSVKQLFSNQCTKEMTKKEGLSRTGFFIVGIAVVGIFYFLLSSLLSFVDIDSDAISITCTIILFIAAMSGYMAVGWKSTKRILERRYKTAMEEYSKQTEEYHAKMEEYDYQQEQYIEETNKAGAEYQAAFKVYENQQRINNEAYNSQMEVARNRYQLAENEIAKMEHTLSETEDVLQKLYAAGPIFPKYQTLIAISTMYEYFVTGRCSELTGANGAYNLYEAELRQNLIINRLEDIVDNLEAIRDNQYVLYTELRSIDQTARLIAADIGDLCDTTKEIKRTARNIESSVGDIAYSQRIAAENAKIAAKNTEAIKYIEIVSNIIN